VSKTELATSVRDNKNAGRQMKGLVKENLDKDGLLLKTDLVLPKPGPGEVKIRVLATSVCGTDKSIYASSDNESIKNEMLRYSSKSQPYRPIIIGHEFCGIIEEIGPRADSEELETNPKEVTFQVGDYVTAEMHLSCGFCTLCRTGNKHICTRVMVKGVHLDGCFAENTIVPHRNLIMLAKSGDTSQIPPRVAAMLDAFGNAVHTVAEADVRGKTVAILGAGPLGLMATMLCKHFGATSIYVTEVADVDRRFTLARAFGADACFDVSKGSAKLDEAVEKFSPYSNGVDIVLELTGAVSAYNDAFRIIRNGGLVVLLGLGPKPIPNFDIAKGVIFKGVTVKGIFGRKMFDTWEMMLRLLECDRFGLQSGLEKILAKEDYALKDYRQAFESLVAGKEMKLVFIP
jgi:threonine 3-dehydrogenase